MSRARVDLDCLAGDDALQLRVLGVELLQPREVARFHTAVFVAHSRIVFA